MSFIKKVIAVSLCLIMVFSIIGFGTFTVSADNPTSGTCGDGLTWDYDESTCTLTISGTGKMLDYSIEEINDRVVTTAPWRLYYQTMKTVVIGNGVSSIGDYAFCGCTGLTDVTIGSDVTSIGCRAFAVCKGLTSLIIPDSVKSIGNYAFGSCTELTKITIPNSVKSIGDSAFNNCIGLTSVTIPDSVTSIGGYAFSGCTGLTSITIPGSVTSIGEWAFSGCAGLESITIPDSVTSIGKWAFSGCERILTLTVPASVKHIDSNAFWNATNVSYTGTATGSPWGARCVNGYIDGNLVYSDSEKTKLVACSCLATGSIIISPSTDTIGKATFSYCYLITKIYLPVNVTRIGERAFAETSLTDVYYEGSTVDKLGISFGDYNSKITEATWHYNSKVSDMPGSPSNPDNPSNPPSTDIPEANIINGNASNNQKTYDYKTTVTFTANVPAGGSVQWYVNGNKAGTGSTLTVKESTNSYTVKVVVTDKNGNQTMDEEQVTIKNGFFDKLIWFFVHLFNPGAYDIKQ